MIAIVVAMKEELDALLVRTEQVEVLETHPILLYRGRLSGREVLLCQGGVGKVAAASTTTELIVRYQPEFLLNVGVAGGLRDGQEIGDLILAEGVTYYDLLFFYEDPAKAMEPYRFTFRQEDIQNMEQVLNDSGIRYHKGWIATGDQFVTHENQWKGILERVPQAVAAEMEGCAIAHVANRFGVPALVIRSLSDVVLHPDNEGTFYQYLDQTTSRAAQICAQFVASFND